MCVAHPGADRAERPSAAGAGDEGGAGPSSKLRLLLGRERDLDDAPRAADGETDAALGTELDEVAGEQRSDLLVGLRDGRLGPLHRGLWRQ